MPPISALAGAEDASELITPERLAVLSASAHHHARRVAMWALEPGTDIEDVRQMLVLAAWPRLRQFDPRRASWPTFVDVVVLHAAWDVTERAIQLKHKVAGSLDDESFRGLGLGPQNEESVPIASAAVSGPASGEECEAVEMSVDVARAIEEMPDHLRRLCRLLQLEQPADAQRLSGLSHAEFYRQVHELRMRLRSLGLRPPGPRETVSVVAR